MKETEIKACPFCGQPAGVEIKTSQGKEYYAIGCKNLTCRGSAWAGDPDAVRALVRWNKRAGGREPEAPKLPGGEGLPPRMCCAALERAIIALNYRAETMRDSIKKRPGAALSSIMDDAIKRDREAVEILTGIMQHNTELSV